MSIGVQMARHTIFIVAVLLCCICLTVSSNGKVSVIDLPYVSGEWYWKLRFFYPVSKSVDGNVGELQNYTFIPKTTSSNVHTNETIKSDNQLISINLVMSTEGSKLQKCVLLLTVEQDEEYFAWTNMTLIYQFAEPLSTLSQSESPISEAKIKSTLQYQQELENNEQNTAKDSESFNSVNVTECIELKDANLNFNNQQSGTINSSSISSHLPPLNRITVISQDDFHHLCALLEFRGYFLITYTNNRSKETACYRIPIDLTEKYSSKDEISYISEKSFLMNHNNTNSNISDDNSNNKSKMPYVEPDNLIIVTTNSSCCDNFLRCFSLPLNSSGNENSLIRDWTIDFYWNRTPEMYEFGEEGWSSVGSPVGALSGVYDLVDVKLKYRFDKNSGFDFLISGNDTKEFIVHSLAEKRLQARVGDYYECVSETQFVFDTENSTVVNSNDNYIKSHNDKWNIIMSLQSVRSQAFADVNVPEFTGASVVCAGDISHDMSLSIAIGLSLCSLVICVLFGLAINHLRQKDEVFKPVDTTGDNQKS
ncbi:unnamed protein product [Schistosoma margrebowiei]|uniref:Uncharacterized protein n=1 Tax=Schistosoma margrebowiei TaxID=48269 RepID=A0AA84ZS74_9TREM|nr:unnamed protein product [Schistosoma margrebowiei]